MRVREQAFWVFGGRSIQTEETASSKALGVLAASENSYESSEVGMGPRMENSSQEPDLGDLVGSGEGVNLILSGMEPL